MPIRFSFEDGHVSHLYSDALVDMHCGDAKIVRVSRIDPIHGTSKFRLIWHTAFYASLAHLVEGTPESFASRGEAIKYEHELIERMRTEHPEAWTKVHKSILESEEIPNAFS